MNPYAIAFAILNSILLLSLPRRWAPLPLLLGACYIGPEQGIEIGLFHFPFVRLVMAAGFIRVVLRKEWPSNGLNSLDFLIVAMAAWALFSSFFHKNETAALIFRLGFVYNTFGAYFLFRALCRNMEDIVHLARMIAILLAPVAIEMVFEKMLEVNFFSAFGGIERIPDIRMGKVRASGPFAHAILAGSVGAACLPIMLGLWKLHWRFAVAGIASCLTMIVTCASSGPILSAMASILALIMWPLRKKMRAVRWLAFLGYIALDIVMKAPAYYIIARVGVVAGSTGWHRGRIIEMAIAHISEWWFAGTDYTRHWMPTGVLWSPDHTDITNYYIKLGVIGGLPLTLIFIVALAKGFSFVGEKLKHSAELPTERQFFIWALGAALFAHAATSLSVSYFDQSFIFLYLTLASTGSLRLRRVFMPAIQKKRKRLAIRVRTATGAENDSDTKRPIRVTKRILHWGKLKKMDTKVYDKR